MNKKLKLVIIIISLIVLLVPITILGYFKLFTDGPCGGFVGEVCKEGYYCRGATQYNEGAGICTRKIIPKDKCKPPDGEPPTWEAPYDCLPR